MKLNNKTITIEYTGRSALYDGALVQGAFVGKEYYSITDVCREFNRTPEQLKKIDLRSLYHAGTTWKEMIAHHCRPVRICGRTAA